jgi:hypothetical protein
VLGGAVRPCALCVLFPGPPCGTPPARGGRALPDVALDPTNNTTVLLCCLPAVDAATGNLPPGVHQASWSELAAAFGGTPWRRELLAGLRAALEALRDAGCRRVTAAS